MSSAALLADAFACDLRTLESHARLQHFFTQMVAIRESESKLLRLFSDGLVRGTVHTCLGQEACAVGVVNALDKAEDIVCSNHRGHGHYLAMSGDIKGLLAEVMGLDSGVCGGTGGSQHLHLGNFYSNGILGGMPPVATGMAAAEKQLGSGRIVCVFLGDGAMAEGSLYEAMNMAALWRLPILFAVEHHQYAQPTPWSLQHAGSLSARASAFGVQTTEVDGNDVEAVFAAATACAHRLRNGKGAQMLLMHTNRLGAHSKGDDLREADELQQRWGEEPVLRLAGKLDAAWVSETQKQVASQVASIVADLKASGAAP